MTEESPSKRIKTDDSKSAAVAMWTSHHLSSGKTIDSNLCPALRKAIDKWSLLAPYSDSNDNEKWSKYYAERSALEFRHENFFVPEDDEEEEEEDTANKKKKNKKDPYKLKSGKALPAYKQCYGWGKKCEDGIVVEGKDGQPDRCSGCNGIPKDSKLSGCVETTEEVNQAWSKLVANDEILKIIYDSQSGLSCRPPAMKPHSLESYADDCHVSGTEHGEYEDFLDRIRERIEDTLESTALGKDQAKILAKTTASGLYILNYYANYEESGTDADVRTVEFGTRLYSPIGNGQAIDLHWYRHYRSRMTIAPEKYSNLFAQSRELGDCNATRPDKTYLNWREESIRDALALLDGDTNEDEVSKAFATLPEIYRYRKILFGDGDDVGKKISSRKVFGLLARASGAHIVRKEGGWVYAGMRKRYELYPGEESDGEEDGPEDGPGGCVIC
jgi:hypothetical protein